MTPELLDPDDEAQDADRTADGDAADAAAGDATDGPATETVTVETAAGTATLSVPPTASAAEAAAVAAAISTHLEEDDEDREEPGVDRWKLSARLGRSGIGRERARTPRSYAGGSEWKFATRAW